MRIDWDQHKIWFRQSGLDTYSLCPERARIKWFESDRPDPNSDATVTGTSLHVGVEANLLHRKAYGIALSTAEMQDIAVAEYERIEAEEGLVYMKGTKNDAVAFLINGIKAWRDYVEPYVVVDAEMLIEHKFDMLLGYWIDKNGVEWEIRLEGKIDTIDRNRVWDWKTAGQPYKQWERQRWAIQPTVYCEAAVSEGLLTYPVKFSYGAVRKLKTKEYAEIVDVQRTQKHVHWLWTQVQSLLDLWDKLGPDTTWPLVDSHALCSPKWCPFWDECKGAHIEPQVFAWKP